MSIINDSNKQFKAIDKIAEFILVEIDNNRIHKIAFKQEIAYKLNNRNWIKKITIMNRKLKIYTTMGVFTIYDFYEYDNNDIYEINYNSYIELKINN